VQRALKKLEPEQADPCLDRLAYRGRREQDDSALWVQVPYLNCRLDSIDARHSNIDQNGLRPEFLRPLNRGLAAVKGFGVVSVKTQDLGQRVCDDSLVVYNCHSWTPVSFSHANFQPC
jgi:hypothetical protein